MDTGLSVQGSSASKESKRRTTVKSGKDVFFTNVIDNRGRKTFTGKKVLGDEKFTNV